MDSRSESLDNSFGDGDSLVDLNSVLSSSISTTDYHRKDSLVCNPVKKLSDTFEGCVKDDNSLKVYLRVRPTGNHKQESTITVDSETTIVTHAPDTSKRALYTKMESRHYMFSRVFGAHSSQAEVFEASTKPMLTRFLQGENCVLFAYGMTNAGKTHTIQGSSQHPGLLPRLVSSLLDEMARHPDWTLHASMLEIYQDNIYDLLAKKKTKLSIRDANGRVEVPHISNHDVRAIEDAFLLLDQAAAKRTKSSTWLNAGSSRSHAIYTLTLHRPGAASGCFQLVDLAGAERSNRAKATSTQLKEANSINSSLMQLWRCLNAIKKRTGAAELVPFRECKLTHLLMPILARAGLTGVAMVVCVNPQVEDYDETISILTNAALASKIREMGDMMGRTAAQALPPPPPPVPTAAPARMINMEDLKEYRERHPTAAPTTTVAAAGVKRRRQESVLSAASHAPVTRAGTKRSSTVAQLSSSQTIPPQPPAPAAAPAPAPSVSTRVSSLTSVSSAEVDQLKEELTTLRETNRKLMMENLTREASIRKEVSEEMAQHSQHLLSVINNLRQELYDKEDRSHLDLTKSCKKARREQVVEDTQRDLSKALEEAEEELERIKAIHEEEVARLNAENGALKEEIEHLRHLQSAASHSSAVVAPMAHAEVNRAKENDENYILAPKTAALAAAINKPLAKSPRSPLSPISSNISPAQQSSDVSSSSVVNKGNLISSHAYITNCVNNNQFGPAANSKTRPASQAIKVFQGNNAPATSSSHTTSPQRLRGAEGQPYFTRLRSQFAR
eukprot:gene1820-1987_t